MASIRRSLVWSFAAKYSDLAISFLSVVVIARLLTPSEIGVWSVGMAIATLAHVVRDFGVSNYLIQERELTTERVRSALGVAIVVAWSMALVVFATSEPIARFYDEPGLRQVLRVLSVTFLVIPISSPVLALLRRDMAFGALYVVTLANAVVHTATAITLAALGFGFMSLAWATLVGAVTTMLVASAYRPQVPRVWPSLKEWQRVGRFGGAYSVMTIVVQVGGNSVDLILGRALGFTAVGLYSRANGLVALFHRDFMGAIRNVTLPAFALEVRESRELKTPYLKGMSFVTVLAWPFYGFLGLMAYPTVRILFGSQWDAAVPLVQILSVAAAVGAAWSLIGSVLLAAGHVKRHVDQAGKTIEMETARDPESPIIRRTCTPFICIRLSAFGHQHDDAGHLQWSRDRVLLGQR